MKIYYTTKEGGKWKPIKVHSVAQLRGDRIVWRWDEVNGFTDPVFSHVSFLLNTYNLWSEDGTFTFPDGTTWYKELSAHKPVTLEAENAKLRTMLAAWVKWEANPDGAPDSGWFAQAQDLAEQSRELLEGKE